MIHIPDSVINTQHGFKAMEVAARDIHHSHNTGESLTIAGELLKDNAYQIRSVGVFVLGFIAHGENQALSLLKNKVSIDPSWQVQEILAKAFDQYCMDIGYEKALPVIQEWLDSSVPNVCRAVTEGLRIWTGRPYFQEYPEHAIQLISIHKASESEYLRKSVGNALRDISKKHPQLIEKEISTWDLENKRILFTQKYVLKKK